MISVLAQAVDAKVTVAAATANCKTLRANFTIKPFQSAEVRNAILPVARSHKAPRQRVQSGKDRSQRTIDDVSDADKMANFRRLLLNCIEPFFPAMDIIRG
ncbi:hypothetical protein [Bradyrhizobium sp.]|jgi:hypothetical protein|uniref:hypothetical protein n=1 Tax=Bradyrhizobium sp. TaxID=376 RepID=UPI003C75E53A